MTGLAGGVDATLEWAEGPELQANIAANANPNLANIQQGAEKIGQAVEVIQTARNLREQGFRRVFGCQAEDITPSGGQFQRIGGGNHKDLELKPAERKLNLPGISVLKTDTPEEAARQMREAFPNATRIHGSSRTVGSATGEGIRSAGLDLMPDPTDKFLNHHRQIHQEGISGFNEENLQKLSQAFKETHVP